MVIQRGYLKEQLNFLLVIRGKKLSSRNYAQKQLKKTLTQYDDTIRGTSKVIQWILHI